MKHDEILSKYNITNTDIPSNPRFKNRSGEITLNGIKIIEYIGKNKNRDTFYRCKCHCGNIFIGRNTSLNNLRSCGCRSNNKKYTHHKYSTTAAEYNILSKLIYSHPNEVCGEWTDSKYGYDNFCNWLYSNNYSNGMQILRKNINYEYSPNNCILARSELTKKFSSDATFITIGKYKYPLSIWCLITGLPSNVISNRYNIHHWSKVDAILTPKRGIRGIDKIELDIPPEIERLNGCGQ